MNGTNAAVLPAQAVAEPFDGKIEVVPGRTYVLIFDTHIANVPKGVQIGQSAAAPIQVPGAEKPVEERERGYMKTVGIDLRTFLALVSVQSFSVLLQGEGFVRVFMNCVATADDPVNHGFNHWRGVYQSLVLNQCFLQTWEKCVVSWKNGKTSITVKGRRTGVTNLRPEAMVTFVGKLTG